MFYGLFDRDKKEASSTTKAFLEAYYTNLDFNKALQLSTETSEAAIRSQADITVMNPYAKEETPDLAFINNRSETAIYIYTCNRVKRDLPLRKINEEWLIDLQGGAVETGGSTDNQLELGSNNQGEFATSESRDPILTKQNKFRNQII